MTLFLCAGDVSGDAHCALLMQELKQRHPDWRLCVLGGAKMQELADEVVGDARGLAVMGIAATYAVLPRFIRLHHQARDWIKRNDVHMALLCDWGAFNGRLIPHLEARKVPVGYYFPPRSWRKSGEGASGLALHVRWFATPFQWDAARLQKTGTRAEWVGHPLLEIVRTAAAAKPREELRREFGAGPAEKLITLLPGSRLLELKYIAPHLAQTARLLQKEQTSAGSARLRFVVATPQGIELPRVFRDIPDLVHAPGRATEALLACDAAIVKSGTATLEAAVCDAPQVVVYDGPYLLKLQGRAMGGRRKIPFVAMPNIIMGQGIVQEFVGDECHASRLVAELRPLLAGDGDSDTVREMRENYRQVRRALGEGLPSDATAKTADMIEELMAAAARDKTQAV